MTSTRLLILDDEHDVGATIASVAGRMGMHAQATVTADAFFAHFDDAEPDLIVLDLVMPGLDGLEVIEHLANRNCRAPLLLITGLGTQILDAARRTALAHGLSLAGVLSKPFTLAQLRGALDTASAASIAPEAPSHGLRPDADISSQIDDAGSIRQALEQGQIQPWFQPKVACSDGQLHGFEVLARWQHPALGILTPDRFIGPAEDHGLIDDLTRCILDASLQWLARHFPVGGAALAVNLSARGNVGSTSFVEELSEHCTRHGIEPQRIALELTESHAMDDHRGSLGQLTRLRMRGFHLAIDDFGTGFSTMQQLVRLPFDEIKLDRSFVGTALQEESSRKVIESLIELGHKLGLSCTAEGVEDPDTLAFLCGLGCDFAQGYHIARPMPGDEAALWSPTSVD